MTITIIYKIDNKSTPMKSTFMPNMIMKFHLNTARVKREFMIWLLVSLMNSLKILTKQFHSPSDAEIIRWAKRKTNSTVIGRTVRMFEALIWMHVLIRGARDDLKKPCFMGVCVYSWDFLTVLALFESVKWEEGITLRIAPSLYWYWRIGFCLFCILQLSLDDDVLVVTTFRCPHPKLDYVYK